jgi:hypothetical protein
MHWEWLLGVIPLVIWIIASLVKTAEEQSKQEKPGESLPPGSPPRDQSEVDKFLEEINRMRRRQEEEQREQERSRRTEPLPSPARSPAAARMEPMAAPNFERPTPLPEKPRLRPVKPRRAETRHSQPKQPAPIVVAPPAPPPPPPPVMPQLAPRPVSPAIAQIHYMLRSPQSVQAAILLQEVLGPPRCRRRR